MADTIACTVGGTTRKPMADGFELSWQLGERDHASFALSNVRASVRDAVLITLNGTARFGGYVIRATEHGGPGAHFFTEIEAVGYEAAFDTILVTKSYAAATTLKALVTDLVSTYLAGRGFTLDAGMATGPALDAQVYERRALSDILRELGTLAGWTYRVSPTKVLSWEAAGSTTAPVTITDAAYHCLGDVEVERSADDYANAVTVIAGDQTAPIIETATDAAEIAAYGQYDMTYSAPNVWDASAAETLAEALLGIRKVTPVAVNFVTDTDGFAPGQLVTVALANRNLTTADYLVQSVSGTVVDGFLRYAVSATSVAYAMDSWLATYRQWSGSSVSSTPLSLAATGGGAHVTYTLGGSTTVSVSHATPTWTEVANGFTARIDGSVYAGRVVIALVKVKAEDAGIQVTPRIYNATTAAVAGTGSAATGAAWSAWQPITLTIAAGVNDYVLQLLPGTANKGVYGYGFVEAR